MLDKSRPFVKGFTIDAPYSRDLDDAFYLERCEDRWKVWVTIADVAHHIALNSDWDQEAHARAFTRYFARSNIPMLPRPLSEYRLSLLPNRTRYTVTFEIHLDFDYQVIEVSVYQSRYRSQHKISHAQLDAMIDEDKPEVKADWKQYYAFAEALIAKRRNCGALVVYDLKKGMLTNEEGKVVTKERGQYYRAYLIVQEFMILANCAVTEYLQKQGVPILFRNHTTRAATVNRDDYLTQLYGDDLSPETLAALAQQLANMLNRAEYGAENQGHYALNIPAYAHWTSPIRRYADLINHRMLIAWLNQDPYPYDLATLAQLGKHITDTSNKHRDSRSDAFKDAATRQLMEADADALHALSDGHFARFVELLCRETLELTGARARVVIEKLEAGEVSTGVLGQLLFYRGTEKNARFTKEWRALKRAALKHGEPSAAALISQAHTQHPGWSEPVNTIEPQYGVFTGTVALLHDGKSFESEPQTGHSKQEALHACCVNLIQVINRTVMPRKPQPRKDAPKPALQLTGNVKGKLFELCQKRRWMVPKFTSTSVGPSNAPLFTTLAMMQLNGETYQAIGRAPSKKLAEQAACRNLIGELPISVEDLGCDVKAPVTVTSANPISAVHEWAQKNRQPFPTDTYTHQGRDNERVFFCTLTLGDTVGKGSGANKKIAKTEAAKVLLKQLQS